MATKDKLPSMEDIWANKHLKWPRVKPLKPARPTRKARKPAKGKRK
jgi:hypothetical protein